METTQKISTLLSLLLAAGEKVNKSLTVVMHDDGSGHIREFGCFMNPPILSFASLNDLYAKLENFAIISDNS